MSVIAGVFARHSPIEHHSEKVGVMLDTLSYRFCDGRTIKKDDNIAFGFGCLKTAIDQEDGVQTSSCGTFTIVGDIRLDNKLDLIQILGLDQSLISDQKIVLQSYRKWGDVAPSYLKGDFAFVIWDRDKNIVFCARDKFGVKPFYYHLDNLMLTFASDIPALVNAGGKNLEVDRSAIACFLVGLPNEHTRTNFKSLQQLPAAHTLTVTKTKSDVRQYWQVKPSVLKNDPQELTEMFLGLLVDAVKQRMPDQEYVATMLSGGLDSSSISCIAQELSQNSRNLGVRSYSLVFQKDSEADESQYIDDIVEMNAIESSRIGPEMPGLFNDLSKVLEEQTELYSAPNLSNMRQIYRRMNSDGIRVVLDGHGGDEVVSNGFGYLYELAHSGKFISLWGEVTGVSKMLGCSPTSLFAQLVNTHFVPDSISNISVRATKALRRRVPFLNKMGSLNGAQHLVNREFATETNLADKFNQFHRSRKNADEQADHLQLVNSAIRANSFAVLDRVAANQCVVPRYPFWDEDLLMFCLGLPGKLKLHDGWTRYILRNSMTGRLPKSIQWRQDKTNFTQQFVQILMRTDARILADVRTGSGADRIAPYINIDYLKSAFERIEMQPKKPALDDALCIWKSVMLSAWLKKHRF